MSAIGALRLVGAAALAEQRRATAFRAGFLVREVLRGIIRPAVMLFVFAAMLESSGRPEVGGYTFPELVHYMVLVAVLQKVIVDERALDVSDQIFEGYVTKYLVMPVRFFTLVLGRFVQFTAVQLVSGAALWVAGALLLPAWWPWPASPGALVQALVLLLLGSYCQFLVVFTLNALAFWMDRTWSLLAMMRFVSSFTSGALFPLTLLPADVTAALSFTWTYQALFAPVQLALGRFGPEEFAFGLAVLGAWAVALQAIALLTWRQGLRRYSGVGM